MKRISFNSLEHIGEERISLADSNWNRRRIMEGLGQKITTWPDWWLKDEEAVMS